MIKFDSINDLFKHENKCAQCNKPLLKYVASAKYEDIIDFGHKTKLVNFTHSRNKLKVTRSITIEDTTILVDYAFDCKNNTMAVNFTPSIDEIVSKFTVAKGFYELDGAKYDFAQNSGLIHIWGILKKVQQPFFVIQECELHFKRITAIFFDEDGEKIEDIESWDEFIYSPTFKKPNQFYVIHSHTSPKTKKKSMSIHLTDKDLVDNLDPQRGFIFLTEPNDVSLMKFDLSNEQKLSRRLATICALKG